VRAFVDAANGVEMWSAPTRSRARLRGLIGENLMLALYTDRERFEQLLDKLTDMTIDVVRRYAEMGGVHSFMTWEDWGLQTSLQIRPKQWREIFKPRYARIIEAAHQGGMHYLWHSCGYIADIIPDMIEMGVDVLARSASFMGSTACDSLAQDSPGTQSISASPPDDVSWRICCHAVDCSDESAKSSPAT
jgi:hypothetical protein